MKMFMKKFKKSIMHVLIIILENNIFLMNIKQNYFIKYQYNQMTESCKKYDFL